MNGPSNNVNPSQVAATVNPRTTKPAPPAPGISPPAPPSHSTATTSNKSTSQPGTNVNGTHPNNPKVRKKNDTPVDPAVMYESLKNRIAALEEEEVLEEEEERKFGALTFPELTLCSVHFI